MTAQATIDATITATATAPTAAARICVIQSTDAFAECCVVVSMRPTYGRLGAMASGRSLDSGTCLDIVAGDIAIALYI